MAIPGAVEVADIELRPVMPHDEPFLLALYISVRAPEFSNAGWDEAQLAVFLNGQFQLQSHHYAAHYDTTGFSLVTAGKKPIGRLYVHRGDGDIRIVDISLLPQWRGRGIGVALLTGVLEEARQGGQTVSLHVELSNPAKRLYERLGFRDTGERHGPYGLLVYGR